MSSGRTTKPAASWRRTFAAFFCVALAGAAVAHAAEETRPPLVIQLTSQAATAAPQINLLGSAPVNCAPTVARTNLDGADLSVELKSPTTGCDARRLMPFNLRIDPTASGGPPILPGQVYRVRAYTTNGGTASLAAFRLVDTGLPTATIAPENGFWWSETDADTGPASAGNGASLEMQDGQLAVGLFGFADSGAPAWYFGSAQPVGHIARVALVQLAGGDPLFSPAGAKPAALPGPRVELEFLSPTRARAYVVRNEAGRDVQVRTMTLARTRFAAGTTASAWSGQWVLVPDDGVAPRVFEFTESSSQDAETFHLGDNSSNASLDCRLAGGTQHPDACTLSVGSTPLADFDQIGLDRLSGHGGAGARVRLLRVTR